AEKGVAFESRLPDIIGGDLDEFARLNPRREVPTLVDDDVRVFDSTIILEYLEDRWPTPALLPASPADRARVRTLEELCDTYYEAVNWAVMEVRVFQRATGEQASRLEARAAQQQAGCNAHLERELGGRTCFNGEHFGWGDLCVVPFVHAAAVTGSALNADSPLGAWLERARARPSVQHTLAAAAQSMVGFEMLPQLVASGQFRREYRDHRLEWMMRSGGHDIV